MQKTIHWRDELGQQMEHLSLERRADGLHANSVIIHHGENFFACHYNLFCTYDWQFRQMSVQIVGEDRRLSLLYADNEGWSVNGEYRADLEQAREPDLSISPFTNSLPINRLKLRQGECAEIVTAYINFPALNVTREEQRYTRLGQNFYRYESQDGSFTRDIKTDQDGFVLDYPGLFSRVRGGVLSA